MEVTVAYINDVNHKISENIKKFAYFYVTFHETCDWKSCCPHVIPSHKYKWVREIHW